MHSAARSKALALVFTLSAALAACRAVLGIEPLELATDAGALDASIDGGVDAVSSAGDSGSGDSGSDAPSSSDAPLPPPDGAPPPNVGDAAACATGSQPCPPCCHMASGDGFGALRSLAVQTGCICAGGGTTDCSTQCASTVCTGGGGMIPADCNMCLDQRLLSAACQPAQSQCATPPCSTFLTCLHSCF